jgi:recombination protein RecR
MRQFPEPIKHMVSAFSKLPGVGPKTALRYAYAVLHMSEYDREQMQKAIQEMSSINLCSSCFTHTEDSECSICRNSERDASQICIVADPRDISTLEATNAYKGYYLVLGGTLNPIDGRTPDTLRIRELEARLSTNADINEVILAFSPDVHGETTMLFLARQLKRYDKKVTRLARGLPMGADIEYADEVTLGSALLGRSEA